ncbi:MULTISPECIES: type IVB secretion system protein IcmH/DotU [unclassified Luteimonas]|uniref:type IVB secretion system protein IcmH/DotU n=1 Tax=Lysobacteraceae TaxID=32033 RepID=UPI00100AD717|nr:MULTISPECIES: type IVB secretion system protein IcmH/DotU [unclassified Luteimonas]MCD9046509.1 type IVB secretion system protein IcmH/DotU [Luteimonas sp. MHLX1A]
MSTLPPVPGAMPSLTPQHAAPPTTAAATPRSLLDLMSDGFYLLVLLKRGQLPHDTEAFVQSIQRFLAQVERGAARLGIASEDIYAAKYAFCAAIDEAVLSQASALRDTWELNPLQLRLFGEHLAGEHFFDRLDELRAQGAPRLPSLEVYHYCLLLGFEGKYRLEGPEKLGYLTARLGDEIVYLKGKRTGFAPHWPPPDNVRHALRRVVPLWAPAVVVACFGLIGYFGLHAWTGQQTEERLAAYNQVVQMPERTAHITITLP